MATIRDLEYFVTLAEKKNFSKAAKACYVSQPTLSGQIQKFENELGITLFERDRKQLRVTPEAKALVKQAQLILTEMRSFKQQAEILKNPLSGDIQLGTIPTLGPYLLAIAVNDLTEQLPDMSFYFHEYQTEVLLDMLDEGKLDVLVLPYLDSMANYNCIEIFSESLVLAAPKNHPLSDIKRLKLDDLKGHQLLTLQDGHCLAEQSRQFCFTAGATEDQRFKASSLETLRYQVAGGLGVTLLPELAVEHDRDNLIHYKHFVKPEPSRMIVSVTRPSYPRMQAIRSMTKVFKQAFKNRRP